MISHGRSRSDSRVHICRHGDVVTGGRTVRGDPMGSKVLAWWSGEKLSWECCGMLWVTSPPAGRDCF